MNWDFYLISSIFNSYLIFSNISFIFVDIEIFSVEFVRIDSRIVRIFKVNTEDGRSTFEPDDEEDEVYNDLLNEVIVRSMNPNCINTDVIFLFFSKRLNNVIFP